MVASVTPGMSAYAFRFAAGRIQPSIGSRQLYALSTWTSHYPSEEAAETSV